MFLATLCTVAGIQIAVILKVLFQERGTEGQHASRPAQNRPSYCASRLTFIANRQTPANARANLQAGLNRNLNPIVQLVWIAAALRNAASVSASAGKKVSSASSDKVTSTGVPNTVVVLMKARVPASVTSCSGMAIST